MTSQNIYLTILESSILKGYTSLEHAYLDLKESAEMETETRHTLKQLKHLPQIAITLQDFNNTDVAVFQKTIHSKGGDFTYTYRIRKVFLYVDAASADRQGKTAHFKYQSQSFTNNN